MNLIEKSFVVVAFVFAVAGCGKFSGTKNNSQGDELTAIEVPAVEEQKGISASGILRLIPDEMGVEGTINYTMYESGLLVYDGFVSYNPYQWSSWYVVTTPFKGRYTADPKTFLSETYKKFGAAHSDFKLVMKVAETNDDLNVVDVQVREQGEVHGRFEIDASGTFIDIQYAEVKGIALGRDVTIRVKK